MLERRAALFEVVKGTPQSKKEKRATHGTGSPGVEKAALGRTSAALRAPKIGLAAKGTSPLGPKDLMSKGTSSPSGAPKGPKMIRLKP